MATLFDDRNPRVSAGLLYVIPFAPFLLLLHDRRNRFLRLHAAQAIVLFGAIAVEQIILYIALVALGARITDLALAAALGIIFLVIGAACGLFGFVMWLRLLADAMAGRVRTYPYLTRAATDLERWVRTAQRWQRAHRWGRTAARDAVRSA